MANLVQSRVRLFEGGWNLLTVYSSHESQCMKPVYQHSTCASPLAKYCWRYQGRLAGVHFVIRRPNEHDNTQNEHGARSGAYA